MKAAIVTAGPDARAGRRTYWLEFAVIVLMFFVAGGAAAPHVNETHYLTKAKHYWNPAYCPGSQFLDSADAHLAYYWTVGWLTLWIPLPAVAWVTRIAGWLLIAAGWMRLSRAIAATSWTAALSALVWIVLVDKCDFAGEWIVGGMHGKGGSEAKCFAYGLALIGLADLIAGRWRRPWIWFGGAAALHVLVGGWAVVAALGVCATEPRERRPALATLLPGLLIGALLSLAGLLPALALDRHVSPADANEAARIYVYERLPHHLAPSALPAADFQRRAVRFGALVIAFAGLSIWLARRSATSDETPSPWQPVALARMMRFAAFALGANCIGLLIALVFADEPLTAARWLRFYWFRQADVMVPAAVALAGVCVALDGVHRSRAAIRLAVAFATLLCASHMLRIAIDRWEYPTPPALGRMEDAAAWLAACDWIREYAPPDAVCLIPRHGQSFKWYAERADVVNWKDVPQDALGVIEWRRRCADIYPTIDSPEGPLVLNSPEQWGARRALVVAQRYGADYIIARSEPPLGLDEVFAATDPTTGGGYSVYQIPPAKVPVPSAAGGATP